MPMQCASGAHRHACTTLPLSAALCLVKRRKQDIRLPQLRTLRAEGAGSRGTCRSCDGQGSSQANKWKKVSSHQLSQNRKQQRNRRESAARAAKSATFSEDPWQEDSGKHDVLESMEEVGGESDQTRFSYDMLPSLQSQP